MEPNLKSDTGDSSWAAAVSVHRRYKRFKLRLWRSLSVQSQTALDKGQFRKASLVSLPDADRKGVLLCDLQPC